MTHGIIALAFSILVAFAAIAAVVAICGMMNDHNNQYPGRLLLAAAVAGLLAWMIAPAHAHDSGQWQNSDPVVREWYRGLMQPDNPSASCCGEADAYWCDDISVRKSKTYCRITDDRDDAPLKRPHVPVGTEVEIPNHKLKWDRGNPVGHSVVFLSRGGQVFCFVQAGGA